MKAGRSSSFDPSNHPRNRNGQFASKGGPSVGATAKFAKSVKRSHDTRQHAIGPVSNAARIRAETGHNVAGFQRVIPAFAVRHAVKSHGEGRDRGERIVRPRDIARAAHRLGDADLIKARGKLSHGSGVRIEHRVKLGNRTAVYIERIGGKDRVLRMVTMRWER